MRFANVLASYLLAALFVPPGTAFAVGEDAVITARVETLLLVNEHMNPFNINTTTKNGVVTLTGGVNDEIQKDLAEDLVRSVPGAVDVINNLIVVPNAYSEKNNRSWSERIQDKTTTASVRTRFLYHREFRGFKIGVETVKGVVTLYGVVNNDAQKQRIADIALETKGVDNVLNNLTVRPQDPSDDAVEHLGRQITDEWLETRVESAILFNRHLSIRELDIEVDDGICILTGSVDSEQERALAGSVAESIQGVNDVRNDIQVRADTLVIPPADRPVETAPESLATTEATPVESQSLAPLEDPVVRESATVEQRTLPPL